MLGCYSRAIWFNLSMGRRRFGQHSGIFWWQKSIQNKHLKIHLSSFCGRPSSTRSPSLYGLEASWAGTWTHDRGGGGLTAGGGGLAAGGGGLAAGQLCTAGHTFEMSQNLHKRIFKAKKFTQEKSTKPLSNTSYKHIL